MLLLVTILQQSCSGVEVGIGLTGVTADADYLLRKGSAKHKAV